MNLESKSSGRFARWRRPALAIFLVLVAAFLIYVVDTICRANFHVVLNGEMYRSGQMNAEQLTCAIQNYGIKSVVNLRGTNTSLWYRDEIETADKWGVRHYDFALNANHEVDLAQMDEIVRTLRAAPKPILIHCNAGADRAGLVCALYCLAIKGQKPVEADRELTVWYGHVPLVLPRTIAMDHSFWRYVAWHARR
jgi:protein tyrosine/serine phosphatase